MTRPSSAPFPSSPLEVSPVVGEEEEDVKLPHSLSTLRLHSDSDNSKSSTSAYAPCYSEYFYASSSFSPEVPDPFFDCPGSIFPLGIDGVAQLPYLFSTTSLVCHWWPFWFIILSFGTWTFSLGCFILSSLHHLIHGWSHFLLKCITTCLTCGPSLLLALSIASLDTIDVVMEFCHTLGTGSDHSTCRHRRHLRFWHLPNAILIQGYPCLWLILSTMMLLHGAKGMMPLTSALMPFTVAPACLLHTYSNATNLHHLLDFDSTMYFEYNKLRFNELCPL